MRRLDWSPAWKRAARWRSSVAHRSMSAWVEGDPVGGAEIARQAGRSPLRCGDARTAVTALVGLATIELRADLDAGLDLMLEAIAEAESTGFAEQAGARAQQPRRVRPCSLRTTRSRIPTSRRRSSSAQRTTRICGTSTPWRYAARNALDRGRWAEAADFADRSAARTHASRPGRTTRRSSCSRSCGTARRSGGGRRTRRGAASRRPGARTSERTRRPRGRAGRGRLARAAHSAISTRRPSGVARGRSRARRCRRGRRACSSGAGSPGLEAERRVDAGGAHALALAGRVGGSGRRVGALRRCPVRGGAGAARDGRRGARCGRRSTTLQELGALPAARLATRRLRALGVARASRAARGRRRVRTPPG